MGAPAPADPRWGGEDRRLADLLIHNDHLSVSIRGLPTTPPDPRGLIARAEAGKYVHAKVRSLGDVDALVDLVRPAYLAQVGRTGAG